SEPAVEQHGGHHGMHGGEGERGKAMLGFDVLQTAADAIGMKPDALRQELEEGKSLAQIAKKRGMKKDELVSKLNDAVSKRLDERVAAGEMSKEKAEAIRAKVSEHMTAAVDSDRIGQYLLHGRHGHGFHRYGSPEKLAKLIGMTEDAL